MSKREAIIRYSLIINKLRKYPSSFKDISDYLEFESELQSYNLNVSKRTFHRDLEDIRSIYNIEIQYDYSKRVYFIDFEDQQEVNERLLEAFDTFNALNIADKNSQHIHFEKRKPQGTENLYGLLHSIKNSLCIKFVYKKYWDKELSIRNCEPYALKEFKNRWYVVAKDQNDGIIKSFALDRLCSLEITNKKFKVPENFNINDYFKYTFGIIGANGKEPEEIVLSFTAFQGKYIKSLPLHETQEILLDNKEKLDIKLKLVITYDLIMEILSFGENVVVIKPDHLVNDLKEIYEKCLKLY